MSHDLSRFVEAQDADGTWDRALAELRRGRKTSHWMWFVFPQLAGLGSSVTAQHYALSGVDEARAYLADPVLGPRLRTAAQTLVGLETDDAVEVLGSVDALKLRSSATLFDRAEPGAVFGELITKFFGGEPDAATVGLLSHQPGSG